MNNPSQENLAAHQGWQDADNHPYAYSGNHRGLISITGPDAQTFLQGQLTCDVATLGDTYTLCAFCNAKGRVITLQILFPIEDGFCLLLPQSCITLFTEQIQKYAVFSKVKIEDISLQYDVFCLATPKPLCIDVPQSRQVSKHQNAFIMRHLALRDHITVICPKTASADWLAECQAHYALGDSHQYHSQSVLAGVPDILPPLSSELTPHDIDLPEWGGVSFSKGCYVGQEIIARMQHRGKRKKKLFSAYLPGQGEAQIKVLTATDSPAGVVVNACFDSTQGETVLLMSLNQELAAQGSLHIDGKPLEKLNEIHPSEPIASNQS